MQTAVEWLMEKFEITSSHPIIKSVIEKAREMEKQQAFEFWQGGMKCTEQGGKSFDQYYHENFTNDTKI